MKPKLIASIALFGVLAFAPSTVYAITLDFASIAGAARNTGSSINFVGTATADTFRFQNASTGPGVGWSFKITLSDGFGDSLSDYGKIDGNYVIGSVAASGKTQTATVTAAVGTGNLPPLLTIKDHAGKLLTGTVRWIDIFTQGTLGGVNAGGTINLSSVTYLGGENDLKALLGPSDVITISFQFLPAKSLTTLKATGASNKTS